jgi:hypothetical protein
LAVGAPTRCVDFDFGHICSRNKLLDTNGFYYEQNMVWKVFDEIGGLASGFEMRRTTAKFEDSDLASRRVSCVRIWVAQCF